MITTPTVSAGTRTARISQAEATRALARVRDITAADALFALQFSAGTTCPPVARVLRYALAEAGRVLGLGGESLTITASEVGAGDPVTRVRRLAHGNADWITTATTAIRVELSAVPPDVRKD
ncbi:uL22 family ribosomal protein [Amycolatopsis sp. GM8]|uniref:uL22 family ribosomal protein n=1 Tax=Amycolatopsis sp. GM8 TaxID=2896530 RepID=UPI001F1CA740|nr:uL22 family ribosomal protein [Amycolatopsis sp. GM8]